MKRLVVAPLTVALFSSCAIIDGLFPVTFTGAETLCNSNELNDLANECWDGANTCSDYDNVRCLARSRYDCSDEWSAVIACVRALEAKTCDDVGDRPSANAALVDEECGEQLDAMESCVGADTIAQCRSDCGSGDCEPPPVDYCESNGLCEPGEGDGCSDCTCNSNGDCEPASENDDSCGDCGCDDDGSCEAGESVNGCDDCNCDFDDQCDGNESELSCPDCGPCRTELCADAVNEACVLRPCKPPLVCDTGLTQTCQEP